MRKKLLVVFGAGFLAGCASPQGLMRGEPVISTVTEKSPQEYVECVGPLWQDFNPSVSIAPTAEGYRLTTFHSMAGTDDVLVIGEQAGGSVINLFQRVQMMRQPLRDAVSSCI